MKQDFDSALALHSQLLVAMPHLIDDKFHESVTLLCEHNEKGALGLVINRPMELRLWEVLKQMSFDHSHLDPHISVYWGGPVSPERGFVIHDGSKLWESTLRLTDEISITTSRDILKDIGEGMGPEHYLVVLGYAGWLPGQLEEELLQNSWLSTPSSGQIVFASKPDQRWKAAIKSMGLDSNRLTHLSGRA
jgi:putative transcriptional regulator